MINRISHEWDVIEGDDALRERARRSSRTRAAAASAYLRDRRTGLRIEQIRVSDRTTVLILYVAHIPATVLGYEHRN